LKNKPKQIDYQLQLYLKLHQTENSQVDKIINKNNRIRFCTQNFQSGRKDRYVKEILASVYDKCVRCSEAKISDHL
jgi:hypothetical protein